MRNLRLPRVLAIVIVIVGACSSFAQGGATTKQSSQDKPNFSGTWSLEDSQTKADGITDYVLVIDHREPDITMTKQFKRGKKQVTERYEYHTNGKPEIYPNRKPDDPPSETKWRGAKLVRRSVSRARGSLTMEMVTREEWSLSSDNQTLTRRIDITMGSSVIAQMKSAFKRRQ